MPRLTDKAWSPYVAGALIGLLQIPAFLFLGTALGASSSFVTVGASVAEVFDPGIRAIRYAAGHLDGAKNWWQVALVIGIALGAFASSRLSGAVRRGVAPVWQRATDLSRGGRFVLAFFAGFLMLMGARIADGCTSGHGLSGMAQLSLGSFAAVTAMFVGGILTATLLFRPVR